ncbi:MAG TPA: response regulator, partial [Candidatus Berkiella sp.]|nr:response regulator [Candidatus Berkiella sp.]
MTNMIPKESILSVDDDPTFLEIISFYLKHSGYIVFKAKNGKEALEIFEQQLPDLILCDLYMPGMSGLELIRILKDKSPNTPVIVISGEGKMEDAISALRLGAWDYIVKPFEHFALEQTVSRVIEKNKLIKENEKMKRKLEEKNFLLTQGLEQLQADQKAAEAVQSKLLPTGNKNFDGYEISYKVMPSLFLSGDFVDYFKITEDKMGFYIADVSGHGASSAFVTVLLKGMITQLLSNYQSRLDETILNPDQVLKYINNEILTAKLGKYLTIVYCVLDLKENLLFYSIGGHYPSPIVWDGKSAYFLQGVAVGVTAKAEFEQYNIHLPTEFSLLMPSDGIFEIMHGKNLKENENRLLEMIKQSEMSIDKILSHLNIRTDRGFPDDVTLLLMNKKSAISIEKNP